MKALDVYLDVRLQGSLEVSAVVEIFTAISESYTGMFNYWCLVKICLQNVQSFAKNIYQYYFQKKKTKKKKKNEKTTALQR